jgi:hypothetical protein
MSYLAPSIFRESLIGDPPRFIPIVASYDADANAGIYSLIHADAFVFVDRLRIFDGDRADRLGHRQPRLRRTGDENPWRYILG